MEELWKDIPDFEGYQVSNIGNVKSFHRKKVTILRHHIDKDGYARVGLTKYYNNYKKVQTKGVHMLMCLAFIGPRPKGCVIRHLDGTPQNNVIDNLRYGPVKENSHDRRIHGTAPMGENNGLSILRDKDIKSIKILLKNRFDIPVKEIAKLYGVCKATIDHIAQGITWKHLKNLE
jgi:hypothetical protein